MRTCVNNNIFRHNKYQNNQTDILINFGKFILLVNINFNGQQFGCLIYDSGELIENMYLAMLYQIPAHTTYLKFEHFLFVA